MATSTKKEPSAKAVLGPTDGLGTTAVPVTPANVVIQYQPISRRRLLWAIPVALFSGVCRGASAQTKEPIAVYKDPTCGCCEKWVQHMEANGFLPTVASGDMKPIKARFKIPPSLESCHTTIVRGFVIEGHVPADDVKRFVASNPKGLLGLTIPGMPPSAPGMDGRPFRPYEVLSFDQAGRTTVFAKHDKP